MVVIVNFTAVFRSIECSLFSSEDIAGSNKRQKVWASASDELALAAIEREACVLCAHVQNQALSLMH